MKRTLVERVGIAMWEMMNGVSYTGGMLSDWYMRKARRIIAMVRRHDRKAGKK